MSTSNTYYFASGPIPFYDPASGKHYSIPLTAITPASSGVTAAIPNVNAQAIADWLNYLVSVGIITQITLSS